MQFFEILRQPGIGIPFPRIYGEAVRDENNRVSDSLNSDDIVQVLNDPEDTETWVRAAHMPNGTNAPIGETGWLETKYLGKPVRMPHPVCAATYFVYACARSEFTSETGGESQVPPIMADFLIALAHMEHGSTLLSNPPVLDAYLTFDRRLGDDDGIGPFLITPTEWERYLLAIKSTDFTKVHRLQPGRQVPAVDFLLRGLITAFAEAAKEAGAPEVQPYIPSFLDIYMARLVGAKAAFAISELEREEADQPLASVLEAAGRTAQEVTDLIERRATELKNGAATHTTQSLRDSCRQRLKDALALAFDTLNVHYPSFNAPLAAGDAPWVAIAEAEEVFWEGKDETTADGKTRIGEYFDAIEYGGSKADPWCGAFAGFCVKSAGQALFSGPARAVNWAKFGDYALRINDTVPPGAIIVTKPAPGTNGSGHVTICVDYQPGSETFIGRGGNQGNTVKQSEYKKENIRAIRMQSAPAAALPAQGDVLTLARTLYGEARGEGEKGMEAVANVILNRAASTRYPASVSDVCLQAWQFSCWNAKDRNRSVISGLVQGAAPLFDKALDIAERSINGLVADITDGALHYHADWIRPPSWAKTGSISAKVGRHIFYKNVD